MVDISSRWSYSTPIDFDGPDRMSIEVGEHLLTSVQPDVKEQHDCDAFVAQVRVLDKRLLYGGAAMLSIVDDELGGHRNRERAHPFAGTVPPSKGSNWTSALTDAVSAEKT